MAVCGGRRACSLWWWNPGDPVATGHVEHGDITGTTEIPPRKRLESGHIYIYIYTYIYIHIYHIYILYIILYYTVLLL